MLKKKFLKKEREKGKEGRKKGGGKDRQTWERPTKWQTTYNEQNAVPYLEIFGSNPTED